MEMYIGETKTIMTFIGTVEITKTDVDVFKAETIRGNHMAKAAVPEIALESLLSGVCDCLIRETIKFSGIKK